MPTVRFIPSGKERAIRAGATILAAANQAEMPIGQSCSGDGICGWCRVSVLEGLENMLPPGAAGEEADEGEGVRVERTGSVPREGERRRHHHNNVLGSRACISAMSLSVRTNVRRTIRAAAATQRARVEVRDALKAATHGTRTAQGRPRRTPPDASMHVPMVCRS